MRPRILSSLSLVLILAACSTGAADHPPAALPSAPPIIAPPTEAPAQPTPQTRTDHTAEALLLASGPQGVLEFDLTTGALTTLFPAPKNAWVTNAAASPDGERILMAYAPPPLEGQPQLGHTDLYELKAGEATPLLEADGEGSYFSPQWSHDGRFVYYVHNWPVRGSDDGILYYQTRIERMEYPAGAPELIVENALWPRLSRDGARLVYVAINPYNTFEAQIVAADLDGAHPVTLVSATIFFTVDAPLFSPDGQTVFFSAVGNGPRPLAWLEDALGVASAFAASSEHNMPGDWWRVPASGGAPTRLTQMYEPGMYADFSPNGDRFFFTTAGGLYRMAPDGSGLSLLLVLQGLGSVGWRP